MVHRICPYCGLPRCSADTGPWICERCGETVERQEGEEVIRSFCEVRTGNAPPSKQPPLPILPRRMKRTETKLIGMPDWDTIEELVAGIVDDLTAEEFSTFRVWRARRKARELKKLLDELK